MEIGQRQGQRHLLPAIVEKSPISGDMSHIDAFNLEVIDQA